MQRLFSPKPTTIQNQKNRKLSAHSESTQSTDDENSFQRYNPSRKGSKYVEKKYKTELCKNFSETGSCPYKKKCKFAHGYEQLHGQNKDQGKHYRTKNCNSFWNEGMCSYGVRCQFCHIKLQSDTNNFLQVCKYINEIYTNVSGLSGSRLLGILQLDDQYTTNSH